MVFSFTFKKIHIKEGNAVIEKQNRSRETSPGGFNFSRGRLK